MAAPATAAGDFDCTESRAVQEWRDTLQSGTVPFRLARKLLTPEGSFKERHHNFLRLSVHDAVDQPLVLQALLLDLPGAGASNNDLQVLLMLAQQGMQDQTTEFFRVDWLNVRAIKISVNVGGEGDAQRIVGVDPYDASVLANELVELVGITDGDVFLAESPGQQRFDDT